MAPYVIGGGGGEFDSGRITIRHNKRREVSLAVIASNERLIVIPGDCCDLYVGDVKEGDSGLEPGYRRIQKPTIVDKQSVSTSPNAKPVVIWRNDAWDRKS